MKRPERPSGSHSEERSAPPPPRRTPPSAPRAERRSLVSLVPPRARTQAPESDRRGARVKRKAEKAEVRRFTRASRRRRAGRLVALSIIAVVGGLIATAVFSPILALREIRVEGTSRLDPAVVATAVSGQLGTPLGLIDDARIRRELGAFPLIRSYATELVPPGTLVIHLVERSPIGVVTTATGFDVVDAAGVVLESTPARPAALPLLQLDADGTGGAAFAAMAEVLLALPPEVLAQVDSIVARTRDDVTLAFAGSDQRVVWGSADDSERKAEVLAALLARFAGAGPGEYDVSAPGSAVFRAG